MAVEEPLKVNKAEHKKTVENFRMTEKDNQSDLDRVTAKYLKLHAKHSESKAKAEARIAGLLSHLDIAEARNADLEQSHAVLQREKDDRIAKMQNTHEQQKKMISGLNDDKTQLEREKADLIASYNTRKAMRDKKHSAEVRSLSDKVAALTSNLKKSDEILSRFRKGSAEDNDKIKQLEQKLRESQKNQSHLSEELKGAAEKNTRLEKDLSNLTVAYANLEDEKTEAAFEALDLEKNLASALSENGDLKANLEEADETIEELEAGIDSVKTYKEEVLQELKQTMKKDADAALTVAKKKVEAEKEEALEKLKKAMQDDANAKLTAVKDEMEAEMKVLRQENTVRMSKIGKLAREKVAADNKREDAEKRIVELAKDIAALNQSVTWKPQDKENMSRTIETLQKDLAKQSEEMFAAQRELYRVQTVSVGLQRTIQNMSANMMTLASMRDVLSGRLSAVEKEKKDAMDQIEAWEVYQADAEYRLDNLEYEKMDLAAHVTTLEKEIAHMKSQKEDKEHEELNERITTLMETNMRLAELVTQSMEPTTRCDSDPQLVATSMPALQNSESGLNTQDTYFPTTTETCPEEQDDASANEWDLVDEEEQVNTDEN